MGLPWFIDFLSLFLEKHILYDLSIYQGAQPGASRNPDFFVRHWYNKEHRHSGIALMTTEKVHYGMDKKIHQQRSQVLADAFQKNPNRFKGKMPVPKSLPVAAWINKPATDELESNLLTRVSHFH